MRRSTFVKSVLGAILLNLSLAVASPAQDTSGAFGSRSALSPTVRPEAAPTGSLAAAPGQETPPAGDGASGGWRWRRAGVAEYAATSLAAAATVYVEDVKGDPEKPKWTDRNGFDESIRDAIRLGSHRGREATHVASDAIMWLMIAAPPLEAFGTLGYRDRDWDALWQTQMVNAESLIFTSFVSSALQNYLARQRPFARHCIGSDCSEGQANRSMPSGHAAFAFTGAGLLCNHHRYQPIYEDPAAGDAICATGIGLAVVDGVLRLTSDRHYATDVLAGTAIGLFSGFLLPRLLHYSHPEPERKTDRGSAPPLARLVSVSPEVLDGGALLRCNFSY